MLQHFHQLFVELGAAAFEIKINQSFGLLEFNLVIFQVLRHARAFDQVRGAEFVFFDQRWPSLEIMKPTNRLARLG